MVPWKLTRVIAAPQNKVVHLRDHQQFFITFATSHQQTVQQ